MAEKKGLGKIAKYVGVPLLGITLFYGAHKFEVVDKAENLVDDAIAYAVDMTSIDAGDAADDYITQLQEEENIGIYEGQISDAAKASIDNVSDDTKADLIEYTYEQLPDSMKVNSAINSVNALDDSLSKIVFLEGLKHVDYETKKEVRNYLIKDTFQEKTENAERDIIDFFKDIYESIEEKVKEVF